MFADNGILGHAWKDNANKGGQSPLITQNMLFSSAARVLMLAYDLPCFSPFRKYHGDYF